tara:strand:+ start:1040 stop:1453 length:414 start_codon:yes stop_codon:yes gene_type:complete
MTTSNYENSQEQRNIRNNDNNNYRNRYGGKRETGGFRIRLSDNEMKSVKNIQEIFQLKSTVAVLGFSVRTLSELIKNENLKEEIIKIVKSNKNSFQKENNFEKKETSSIASANPFARPEKKIQKVENKENNENLDEK